MSLSVIEAESTAALQILNLARSMIAKDGLLAAIEYATRENRRIRAPELDWQLAVWRSEAFPSLPTPRPRPDWPPQFEDPFPGQTDIPSIDAADLSPEIVGGAIQHHGVLCVRGLIDPARAASLQQDIDRTFAARDAYYAGAPIEKTMPWYVPWFGPKLEASSIARRWVESSGAAWTVDSPRVLFDLVDMFQDRGIIDVIAGILGERPALSIRKSTLRRVPHTLDAADWHQDGAFLGAEVRTINVWLGLSDCGGGEAPGLDVVSRRLPYVMQGGSHGANFSWSVGPGMIELLEQGGAQVVSPVFKAGDALLFDQLMLHRTGIRPNLTKDRWAVESWFFAPSTFPMDQTPIVV